MSQTNKRKPANKHIGKVGWCSGPTLGLDIGHFVFIRRVKNGKCDVNTLSSIKTSEGRYQRAKIQRIENGSLYPIPVTDVSVSRFSGIDKRVIKNIPITSVHNIGRHRIKRRHHHYIQKYMK